MSDNSRLIISLCLVTVFISIFFIFFVFNGFSAMYVSQPGADMLIPMIFSLIIIAAFVAIDIMVVFYMLKSFSVSVKAGPGLGIEDLKNQKEELRKTKAEIERKYYRRELDEKTFHDMLMECEKRITEIEAKIKYMRKNK